MSTNINITVGDNALLDAAKQQQAANRQAQLNREASTRLEGQATAARTAALVAQGRDANGNLITGAPFTQPQIERRPAANRIASNVNILLAPNQTYSLYGVLAQTKKIRNLNFVDSYFQDLSEPVFPYDRFIFQPTGGPAPNTTALEVPVAATTLGNYCELEFIVTDNNFVQSVGFLSGSGVSVQIEGNRVPWQSSVTAKDIPVFTAEMYIRAGDGKSVPGVSSADSSCSFDFMRFGATIELYQRTISVPAEPDPRLRYVAFVGGSDITEEFLYNIIPAGRSSEYDGGYGADGATGEFWLYEGGAWSNIGIVAVGSFTSVFVYELDFGDFYSSLEPPEGNRFPLGELQGVWRHLAYVRDQTESRFYLDGFLLATGTNTPIPETDAITGSIEGINGRSTSLESAFHGYRVTPKVLYTGNFTPPPSITSFA